MVIYELLGQKVEPELQDIAAISQANPVSGTKYTVLDTTRNVRVYGISAKITWATTQPTPLEVHGTIDGRTVKWSQGNPVSGTWYYGYVFSALALNAQVFTTTVIETTNSIVFDARSVKIEAEITWATTQPTPLLCRVLYAKW